MTGRPASRDGAGDGRRFFVWRCYFNLLQQAHDLLMNRLVASRHKWLLSYRAVAPHWYGKRRSGHPRLRRDNSTKRCATPTISLVQSVGHATSVNYVAQYGCNLARQRARIESAKLPLYSPAYRCFGGVGNGIEGLHLELSFILCGLVKSEFSREIVGARDRSDTAMLIPFSTDLHFSSLQAMKSRVSIMVLQGVLGFSDMLQHVDSK